MGLVRYKDGPDLFNSRDKTAGFVAQITILTRRKTAVRAPDRCFEGFGDGSVLGRLLGIGPKWRFPASWGVLVKSGRGRKRVCWGEIRAR